MPQHIKDNVESFKFFFNDVELYKIDETNFDINSYQYAYEAYQQEKYAFVSDVARLHFLNETGGIYLDATVTIKQNFEGLLGQRSHVFGIEYYQHEITGVLGAILMSQANSPIFKEVLNYYKNNPFTTKKTINQLLTEQLELYGFKYKNKQQILTVANMSILITPVSYFSKGDKSIYAYPNSLSSWTTSLSSARKLKRFIGKMIKKLIGRTRYNKYIQK